MCEENVKLNEEVQDELSALEGIYGDAFSEDPYNPQKYKVKLNTKNGSCVNCNFSFPNGYPEHEPPTFRVSAHFLTNKNSTVLERRFLEIWTNAKASCIYDLIEETKEMVKEFEETSNKWNGAKPTSSSVLPGMKCPEISRGSPILDRRSKFLAYAAEVSSLEEAELVIRTLKQEKKISIATHNIVSYRIKNPPHDFRDDDGETGAGDALLTLLQKMRVNNVVVMVSRWSGGVRLGPDRFRHICNAAKTLLKTIAK